MAGQDRLGAAVGWGAQGQKRGQLPRISQRVTRGGTVLSAEGGGKGGGCNILGTWKGMSITSTKID